jgi:hypothetical protein
MITIFRRINGIAEVVCEVGNHNASYLDALMGRNEVVVSVTVEEPLPVLVGDYMRHEGVTYTLNREPDFTKKSDTEYQYSLVFEHPSYVSLDKVYTYRITDETRFWLTGTLADFLGLWLENISELDSGWSIGACPATQRKNIRFESMLCRDVLNKLVHRRCEPHGGCELP